MSLSRPVRSFLPFLFVCAFCRVASADPMGNQPVLPVAPPSGAAGEARTAVPLAPRELDPAADATLSEPAERQRWYGGETLAADGLSLVLMVAAAGTDSEAVATASGLTYLLGGPAVHLGHERVGVALGSLGLRVGLPVTGALVGATAANCNGGAGGDFCGLGEVAIGLLVGMVSAVALDASLLAREPVREARGGVALAVAPTYSRRDRASGVALLGSF